MKDLNMNKMSVFIISSPIHYLISKFFSEENDIFIIEDFDFVNNDYFKNEILLDKNVIFVNNYRKMYKKPFYSKIKLLKICKKLYMNKIDSIYAFNDADPIVQFVFCFFYKKGINTTILEEGIGLYNDMHHNFKMIKICFNKLFIGKSYELIKRIGEYKFTKRICSKKFDGLNDVQIKKYCANFNYPSNDMLFRNINLDVKYESNVYFVGQPLVEDGICSLNSYLECVRKCSELLYGKKIVIKPHPRENVKKYSKIENSVVVEDKYIPFESLINSNEKNVIISISSSSLNNLINNNNLIIYLFKLIETKVDYSNIVISHDNVIVAKNYKDLEVIINE